MLDVVLQRIEERMKQLDRSEWKLDQIIQKLGTLENISEPSFNQTPEDKRPEYVLHGFTTKQHGVMQMLCRSAGNADIARRFNISENTAKIHVRTVAKRLGVSTRPEIVLKVLPAWKEIDEESYQLLTKGLPKDWDAKYDTEGGKAFDHLLIREDDAKT